MMRSKWIQKILHWLMLGIGAGAGVALAFLCVQVHRMTSESAALPFGSLALLYLGMGGAGALLGELLAPKMIAWCGEAASEAEKALAELTFAQLAAMSVGVITGLLIAALLTQVLNFLGDSIFTLAISATLYVVLGAIGLTVGKSRTDDFAAMLSHLPGVRRTARRHGSETPEAPRAKVLDGASLIDGRIEAVYRTGFIEGELLLPDFVLQELHALADSPDAARRVRGQRGLQVVARMQADERIPMQVASAEVTDAADGERLLALVQAKNAVLLTSDLTQAKNARQAGIPVMNLNDLAVALRTVTAAGDVLAVKLTKTGREAEQGVGYLEDGTMIVVEGGRAHVGQTVEVTVTSVLQTNAGRMVFAKMN